MSDITLEQIQSEIEDFGSDSLRVVGGKFEGGIHLQQVPDEIAPCIFDLLRLKEEKVIKGVKNFLEIGSASGGNAFLFNHFFGLDRIILIDDNKHKKHGLRGEILKDIPHDEFIGNSHSKEAEKFVEDLGVYFDILFIDGDHSYNGVKKDTLMYSKFVDYQGFIIYHDTIACPQIGQYVKEARSDANMDFQFIKRYESKVHAKPCGITMFRTFNLPFVKRG